MGITTRAKLARLLKSVEGRKRALVLPHDNPDPDALAAAWGLATILQKRAGIPTVIGYGGIIGRAENAAFVRLLKLPLTPLAKLRLSDFDLFALTDTQESIRNHSLPEHLTADIVIDHHPLREKKPRGLFADLGGRYGATSTIVTEYLHAAKVPISRDLATALYYGIKVDTHDLERETSRRDIDAYLWLFPRIRRDLLMRIEHPRLPARYFKLYFEALRRAQCYPGVIVVDMGPVFAPDMVAELAERFASLEGTTLSLAFGIHENQLYMSLRCNDRTIHAGRVLRALCSSLNGSAGGHGTMAGARIPLTQGISSKLITQTILENLGVDLRAGVRLLDTEE